MILQNPTLQIALELAIFSSRPVDKFLMPSSMVSRKFIILLLISVFFLLGIRIKRLSAGLTEGVLQTALWAGQSADRSYWNQLVINSRGA
jgi:hypothetical protein